MERDRVMELAEQAARRFWEEATKINAEEGLGDGTLRGKILLVALAIVVLNLSFCACLVQANRAFDAYDARAGLGYLMAGIFGMLGVTVFGSLLIVELFT